MKKFKPKIVIYEKRAGCQGTDREDLKIQDGNVTATLNIAEDAVSESVKKRSL